MAHTAAQVLSVLLLMAVVSTAWAQSSTAADGAAEATVGPTLSRALVARGVENRLPLDTEGPFAADGERLYIYLEVDNRDGEPTAYTVNWHHLDRELTFSQTIEVGQSRRWRTWVYHRLSSRRIGNWAVQVVSPSGEIQAELAFTVVEDAPVNEGAVAETVAATAP